MSQELNIGKLGAVAPFKAIEGKIDITETATAHGVVKGPVLQYPLKKGDLVELDSEMAVKALSSGVPIGIVYNTPKWEVEPRTNYTAAQAKSGGILREVGMVKGTIGCLKQTNNSMRNTFNGSENIRSG